MNTPRLMTQADFATHRGVGRSAVSNWKTRGLLVFGESEGGQVMVDVARSEARLNAKVDPTRGRPSKAAMAAQDDLPLDGAFPLPRQPASAGVADVRLDLVRAQTVKVNLDNARRAKDLVAVEEAERRVSEIGRVARERMLSFVRSFAERFAAEKDPRQIVTVGTTEIERIFSELADRAEAGDLVEMDEGDALAAVDAEIEAEVEAASEGVG